jgi:copper chaperone
MSERSERMDDRATASESGVDGVGGRSPLEGMSERSEPSAPTERMDEHTTLTFVVPGVSCAHCQAAITDEVGEVDGVEQVIVDLATKVVTVTGRGLSPADVVEAIDEAGYEVVEP